eukprot:g47936.t1
MCNLVKSEKPPSENQWTSRAPGRHYTPGLEDITLQACLPGLEDFLPSIHPNGRSLILVNNVLHLLLHNIHTLHILPVQKSDFVHFCVLHLLTAVLFNCILVCIRLVSCVCALDVEQRRVTLLGICFQRIKLLRSIHPGMSIQNERDKEW